MDEPCGSNVASGYSRTASVTVKSKRARAGSVGIESDDSERVLSGKKLKYDEIIKMIIEESRKRRKLFEELKDIILELGKNKTKEVVDKLLKVRKDRGMSMKDLCILQQVLAGSKFLQELFLLMEGDFLDKWIDHHIEKHSGK